MNRYSVELKTLCVALACIGLVGCSSFKLSADKPVASAEPSQVEQPATASPEHDEAVVAQPIPSSSTITELQQLIDSKSVNELRTSYNGSYGTSLLFKRDTLTYYVALFRRQNFWRVVKTQDEARADRLYQQFVTETNQLAEVDLKRIRLEADYAHTAQQLDQRNNELSILRNDLEVQRQQQAIVTAQQAQAKREARQLAEQESQAREQLQALQAQIKALERQREALGAETAQGL